MPFRRSVFKWIVLLACGVSVVACGDSPAEPDGGSPPVVVAIDVCNEDGEIGGSSFNGAKDNFVVGEGGAPLPDALVYEILVTNNLSTTVHEIVVSNEISPHFGILACSEIRDQDPAGGANPSTGVIVGADCTPDGFVWEIGTLDGGESATLYFRAEALADGDDINRVLISAEGLASAILIEEPTLVGGPGPALSLSVADGHILGDVFSSSIDPHFVGAGSAVDPDALVYQIVVTNQSAVTATGVEVSALIPGAGLACGEIREGDPAGGANPNIGLASCTIEGFGWLIGSLSAGQQATLYIRVEALSPGNHVSRVTLRADALSRDVSRDELTTIVPAPLQ